MIKIKNIFLVILTLLLITAATDTEAKQRQRPKKRQMTEKEIRLKDQSKRDGRKRHIKDNIYKNLYLTEKRSEEMVLVERGHLSMGLDEQDSLWGFRTPTREISVEDFLMDPTEVTNAMYHEFINDIIKEIVNERRMLPMYAGDVRKTLNSLYIYNKVTGEKRLDPSQIIYAWQQYDYLTAAKPEYQNIDPDNLPLITKDTAYVNNDGKVIREKITRYYTGDYDFLNTYIVNVYPDTLCWISDFPYADNEMYMRYYFSHPDYQNYPVVGVSWEQANAYCAWRTEKQRQKMGEEYGYTQPFRLPTEAEWEHAARGRENRRFAWMLQEEGKGRYYANFMPAEGDYTGDGNVITSRVGTYLPNEYGLYDMAGNVAEWTSTSYNITGVVAMNNINPEKQYSASQNDNTTLRLKAVRGGSWKDSERFIQSAWRTAEEQNKSHSYIGFRCVQSIAATPTGKIVLVKSRSRKK